MIPCLAERSETRQRRYEHMYDSKPLSMSTRGASISIDARFPAFITDNSRWLTRPRRRTRSWSLTACRRYCVDVVAVARGDYALYWVQ